LLVVEYFCHACCWPAGAWQVLVKQGITGGCALAKFAVKL
jgi:hypothetical protein